MKKSKNLVEEKNFKDISDHKPRTWLLIILIIVALAIVVALINKVVTNNQNKKSVVDQLFDNINEQIDETKDTVDEDNEYDVYDFNFDYSNGTKYGNLLNSMLDDVITNNKTNSKLISVKYNDVNTTDPTEIKNLKKNFETFTKYEVSLDYDEKGYVNLITIEDLEENTKEESTSQKSNNNAQSGGSSSSNNQSNNSGYSDFDKASFNNKFVIFEGKIMGGTVNSLLNTVITSNKTESRIITVNFDSSSVTSETEIANIQSKLQTFDYYRVSLGYDTNGFVNTISIQKEA